MYHKITTRIYRKGETALALSPRLWFLAFPLCLKKKEEEKRKQTKKLIIFQHAY